MALCLTSDMVGWLLFVERGREGRMMRRKKKKKKILGTCSICISCHPQSKGEACDVPLLTSCSVVPVSLLCTLRVLPGALFFVILGGCWVRQMSPRPMANGHLHALLLCCQLLPFFSSISLFTNNEQNAILRQIFLLDQNIKTPFLLGR